MTAVLPGGSALVGAGRGGALRRKGRDHARLRRIASGGSKAAGPVLWIVLGFLILAPCACFLLLAISPRLFSQGPQWFTTSYLKGALSGNTAVSLVNSIWVSSAAAGMGIVLGFPIAWLAHRTTMPGRRLVAGAMWAMLLLPSWITALGWQRLVQPDGVLYRLGIGSAWETHLVMGPIGVVAVLGLRNVPFAYLAISAALAGLGQEFEDAARVHGASRLGSIRLVAPILAPAIWSAIAIGFAETISDFGVASTLAYSSHFSLATYQLYQGINGFPPSFPVSAAMGWLLVGSVALPLALQARALRGRSYAVLSGRSRKVQLRPLARWPLLGSVTAVSAFFVVAIGVPAFGAISDSLFGDFGASFQVSFTNYRQVFSDASQLGPLDRSFVYAVITATITVIGGFIAARLLSKRRTRSTKVLDFLLLAAVALPSVVFAAGYIFAYNLPFLSRIGIDIYQTTTLLVIGYIASSLPTNARVLVGAVSQLQASLHDAARAHGAGALGAWFRAVLPIVSRPLVMAWLLTFTGVFLELPISQLLYAPGSPPISVAIENNLGNYHFGVGMAQMVVSVMIALGAVGMVLGSYRLFAPRGWRRIGGGTRD